MIFKNGNRTFYVVSKKEGSADKAAKIANGYFKTAINKLEVQSGKLIDEETVKIGCKGDLWVISRKGKA